MRRCEIFRLIFLSFLLFSCPDFFQARPLNASPILTEANKNILVLYSYNNNIPSQQNFTSGLEQARKTVNLPSGNFIHEYLDISLKDHEERILLRNLLLKRYAGKHFDLIVTLYDPALDFLLNEGKDLSPESTCMSIFNRVRPGLERAGKKVIQFPLHFDLSGTLELSLKLFPQTRKVLLVMGASKTDILFENRARVELLPWKNKLEFEYTSGRSVEEVLKRVGKLSPHTIVISSRIESDITGKVFVPRDMAVMLARASCAPVFCLVSTQLDTGMVGGSMIDVENVGAMLSQAVVALAKGETLDIEPISKYIKPMVNWQQINRWKINPKDLPAGSLIINQPQTLWTRYKEAVVGAVLVFFVLTSFIIALLIQNRRRATAEKSALDSESRFRVLFNHAPDAIIVYDYDLAIVVDVNTSAEKLFGCSREKLMKLWPLEFYLPEQPDGREVVISYQEHLEQALAEKTLNFERAIRTAVGRNLFCEVHMIRLPSEKSRLIRVSYIDISERKRAEEALRQEKERYQSILRTAMNGFCLTDMHGCFLEVNDAFSQMSGYSVEELKTMGITDVESFDDYEEIKAHIKTVMKNGRGRFETRYRHKDGHLIDVEASVSYQCSEENHFITFIRDITELKQAEAERKNLEYQLQQSQKMEVLGTLAGGIAHDFNNILFPIIGFTEMLIDTVPEDNDYMQSLNEILKASLRAADLVQQILAFSRQSEIELMPLKTQIIFNDTIKLMRASMPSTISIESAIDNDCGMVLASATHIHQIAMNLMTNAFHAMEDSGGTMGITLCEVEITVDDVDGLDVYPGRFLHYLVSDTGHGIGKHILDKIFDPYFTTKKAGKGTGLGLSVVQGIVKSYGGDIRVRSEPGIGTEFHVYLPVVGNDDDVNPATGNHLPNNKGNEHILLVDDEETILRMEKKMLERMGYRVSICSNSLEALELFRSSSDAYDLVITDMTMPDLTGEKFAAELKQIRKEIPVILCTGFSSKTSSGSTESLGVDGFLMKPVGKRDLLKTIRSLLDGKKES
jgi:PAS domain S-box-containing protein